MRCRQSVITAENMPSDFRRYCESQALPANNGPDDEAETIRKALNQTGGNKTEAAKRLGVSRATLYRYLDQMMQS